MRVVCLCDAHRRHLAAQIAQRTLQRRDPRRLFGIRDNKRLHRFIDESQPDLHFVEPLSQYFIGDVQFDIRKLRPRPMP